ncbi:MAG: NAD(P)-dependent glycerol-3-phosphate dehydrogenase [Myxococcales bacterium]|nr:NAD(P)-dependent glycerol-3-phosphate dehydrogenase [Myxococcales bacterium]
MEASHIGVLGGGSWGTAIAHILRTSKASPKTLLWLRDPDTAQSITRERRNPKYLPDLELADGIETTGDLHEVAQRCELIFVVVPTKVMRPVMNELGNHLHANHVLVSCSKGLEPGTARRMTQIFREETCCLRVGALSGPNLAKEVVLGHPSATVVASDYDEVVTRSQEALFGPRFRVYGNPDLLGVELCGALKNVIAIASGVAEGLGYGDNTKTLLVTRGLAELSRFLEKLGGHPKTMAGLAGMGDLMATCGSPLSRNHQVGLRIARGQSLEQIQAEMRQVAEGVNTVKVACELGARLGISIPISRAVFQLVHEGRPALDAITDLMTIVPGWEVDR